MAYAERGVSAPPEVVFNTATDRLADEALTKLAREVDDNLQAG
ncbi:hypothetical protein [Micromonospora craniellae]|nr:hypothetical protein [Micromonospora craniellae]